uniref:SUN domain-containing protein n=1 Tax=Knipowitschia caucasica TaxID=637954 RepID=A0AAV2JZP5_KNICA
MYRSPSGVLRAQHYPLTPGQYWRMEGSSMQLFIAMATHIHISHVTIGHITAEQSPNGNISSAPKEFSVYGLKRFKGEETLLGKFEFQDNGESFQTFEVHEHMDTVFKFVRLQVENNHGSDYTCLYNFRVHGNLPTNPPPLF